MNNLEKNTNGDKRNILHQNLSLYFKPQGEFDYLYLMDFDDQFVYFEIYDCQTSAYLSYRVSYSYNETTATFGDDLVEVVRTTDYKVVEPMSQMVAEKSLEKKLFKWLDKYFGGSKENKSLPVVKGLFEEDMISIEPLYVSPGETDGVGETVDEEGVEQLVKSVNEAIASGTLKANYFHSVWTEDFKFLKAWVNPYDCRIGDTEVQKGLPIIEVQYLNKSAWEARKSGKLMGLSIEGTCEHEELE